MEDYFQLEYSSFLRKYFKLDRSDEILRNIGNAANYVEIKTFHSYCFDLLGKVGTIEKSTDVIREAIHRIENGEVEASGVTKLVLVIDEAQDMDKNEAELIQILIQKNPEMRVIAVGDDDQNIYSFRGSDSGYMRKLLDRENARLYELIDNYRSKSNLVQFANVFAGEIGNRLKHQPIMPVQGDSGQIRIIQYLHGRFLLPAVNELVSNGIYGSTGILTLTNEEALLAAAILKKNGIQARMIKSNEGFELDHMVEIRYFIQELHLSRETYIIQEDAWSFAIKQLKLQYAESKNLEMCLLLLKTFEEISNNHKYISDFIEFIKESREEDFYERDQGFVTVATIHKAKGMEFDHVVILLNNFYLHTDEAKRQLYVGITRAKKSLTIHYNNDYFSVQRNYRFRMVEKLQYINDNSDYEASNCIVKQLRHKDIFLSYFYKLRKAVEHLKSGDKLLLDDAGCLDGEGNRVMYFSKQFQGDLQKMKQKGYQPVNACVDYILYWEEDGKGEEVQIVLPILEFERD